MNLEDQVLFQKVMTQMTTHLNLTEVLQALAYEAAHLLHAAFGRSYCSQELSAEHWIRQVIESQEPLFMEDCQQDNRFVADAQLVGVCSAIILPIQLPEKNQGALGIFYHEPVKNLKERFELALRYAQIVSLALEQATIYDLARQEIDSCRRIDLVESEEKYRLVFQNVNDAIYFIDIETLAFIEANQSFLDLFGYTQQELASKTLLEITAEPEQTMEVVTAIRAGRANYDAERWYRHKDGHRLLAEIRAGIFQWRGRWVVCAVLRDITERKLNDDRIAYLAFHDSLTGLPNRRLAEERLGQALSQAKRSQKSLAVFFLDFDGMKTVNDTLGHEAGDQLLRNMAASLTTNVREGDTVARLGGDELLVILPVIEQREIVEDIARRLIEQCQSTLVLEQQMIRISVSIGISFFPDHGQTGETLIKNADRAMYQAKRLGGNQYCVYE